MGGVWVRDSGFLQGSQPTQSDKQSRRQPRDPRALCGIFSFLWAVAEAPVTD